MDQVRLRWKRAECWIKLKVISASFRASTKLTRRANYLPAKPQSRCITEPLESREVVQDDSERVLLLHASNMSANGMERTTHSIDNSYDCEEIPEYLFYLRPHIMPKGRMRMSSPLRLNTFHPLSRLATVLSHAWLNARSCQDSGGTSATPAFSSSSTKLHIVQG